MIDPISLTVIGAILLIIGIVLMKFGKKDILTKSGYVVAIAGVIMLIIGLVFYLGAQI